ncbi:MAG: tetratricopeptide repeat protein [Planctomycetes bacterium]|nr:tetratricopeptide repeat protein [Planctomycetota bacterium]
MIAVALVFLACDPPKPPPPIGATTVVATIPDPVFDPAAQKLTPALGPAYGAIKAGRFDDARKLAEDYMQNGGADAHRGQAEFVIGLAFHRQLFYDSASERFLRGLQLEPGFIETYYYAGHALFNVGRLDEARAAFAVFARHHPDDPSTAFGQGLVEFEADRIDAAEVHLQRAIDLSTAQRAKVADPRAIDADLGRYKARLGDVYMRRDDVARAKELFASATSLRSESPEVWSKLAVACERLGDKAGAEKAWRKFTETTNLRAQNPVRSQ